MPGGLVQIVAFGSEDIFLTGTPQITFFKAVYRHHTNFAIESVAQYFISEPNFGHETTSIINKGGGDLMGKVYLEIDIPRVDLVRRDYDRGASQARLEAQYSAAQRFYQRAFDYVAINSAFARKLDILVRANNIQGSDIERVLTDAQTNTELVTRRSALIDYVLGHPDLDVLPGFATLSRSDLAHSIKQIDVQLLALALITPGFDSKPKLQQLLRSNLYGLIKGWYMPIYTLYQQLSRDLELSKGLHSPDSYSFAWVAELGHAVIEQISVQIGNQTIDTHTTDWFIIYNDLFLPVDQLDNYRSMIGFVPELTSFNPNPKPAYRLIIPLQFWFCRETGLAVPLIALQYHDIVFNLRLRELDCLCYVDACMPLTIPNIQAQYDLNLTDCKLYVDYIYLDTDERQRFGEASHEYLIEIVQYNEFTDINGSSYIAHMTFDHPTKFVAWFMQTDLSRSSLDPRWGSYTTPSTLNRTWLRLNLYNRTDPDLGPNYYNSLQPYWYFNRTPRDGLYVYSFSINPTLHQPSGSVNLSRIDDFSITVQFEPNCTGLERPYGSPSTPIPSSLYMGVYVLSYNILRIMSGMASLAFQTH